MSDEAAIIERLDRIERALARLAVVQAPAPVARESPGRLLLTRAQACASLACSETTLRGYVARGALSEKRPRGKGPGKPVFYLRDEVECLALSGEEAAREMVARKQRGRGV